MKGETAIVQGGARYFRFPQLRLPGWSCQILGLSSPNGWWEDQCAASAPPAGFHNPG
jgi:hypothetical protein